METNRNSKPFLYVMILLLAASVILSGLTLYRQTSLESVVQQQMGNVDDIEQEDDVTIAREYTIKSTLPISDAYITGDTSKLEDVDKETLDMAKEIINENIKPEMTDYEKEKAIYEYLTAKLQNDTGILTVITNGNQSYDNPHDVLKYHSAVCVGYATTFRMFMQMLGIECKVVHSTDLTHSWDLVKLKDGWYHVDCYFDSGNSTYSNFNMDDQRCSQSHDWTRDYYPQATGKEFNYIFSICEELNSIYDVPKWIVDAVKDHKTILAATFKEGIKEGHEQEAEYMASRIVDTFNCADSLSIGKEWQMNEKNQYILVFRMNYFTEDSSEIDDKTQEKIENRITKDTADFINQLMANPYSI